MVKSAENKADQLTRVPKRWLNRREEFVAAPALTEEEEKQELIRRSHNRHHLGVDRSLYVMQRTYPEQGVTRQEVEQVVKNCPECLSVDPSPVRRKRWKIQAPEVDEYGPVPPD